MDYFKDLSYYSRFHFENAKNIGFCGSNTQAAVQKDPEWIRKLTKFVKYPVNTVRGSGEFRTVRVDEEEITLGFSELRIIGKDGVVYAAPDDVIANILDGTYDPPAEFVDAVENGADPESEAYQAYLRRYSPDTCWGASGEYVADVLMLKSVISTGDPEKLKRLLAERPGRIDIVTDNGSLLNEAIEQEKDEVALYLLEAGIQLDKFEGVELLTAVEHGRKSVVMKLMEHNIPIKMDRPRNNPLFLAIGRNQNEIAAYLYQTRKALVKTYNTEFMSNCNILQWTKLCRNSEFMDLLMNQYQTFQ